jgi:hypothetical protein
VKVLGFAGQAGVARNVSPAQASPIGIEPAAPKRWFIRSFREYLLIEDFCYIVQRKSISLKGSDAVIYWRCHADQADTRTRGHLDAPSMRYLRGEPHLAP